MYGYLPMLGLHTFNGVAFTPDLEAWKPLDPKEKTHLFIIAMRTSMLK